MKKANKITLSIVVFIVFIVLMIVFVINPLYQEAKEKSQELVNQKKQLSILETKIGNLERFKILYKSLEDILEKIDNLFVDSEVPVEFITFLETTADNSNLIIDISPGSSGKFGKDPWPSIIFKTSLTGEFPNFLKFMEKLENSQYLIEIQNLAVNKKTTGVEGTLTIKVFVK